jgi:isoamylase
MSQADWSNESTRCLAIFLDGGDDPDTDADGCPLIDDDFLVLLNGWKEPVEFVLPTVGRSASWVTEIDTALLADPTGHPERILVDADCRVLITDFSLMVLRANHQISAP